MKVVIEPNDGEALCGLYRDSEEDFWVFNRPGFGFCLTNSEMRIYEWQEANKVFGPLIYFNGSITISN